MGECLLPLHEDGSLVGAWVPAAVLWQYSYFNLWFMWAVVASTFCKNIQWSVCLYTVRKPKIKVGNDC